IRGRVGDPQFGRLVNLVRLRGEGSLPGAYEYRFGDPIPGMLPLEVDDIVIEDLGLITIRTSSPAPPHGPLFRSWNIAESGIPSDLWLRPDGTKSIDPCSDSSH